MRYVSEKLVVLHEGWRGFAERNRALMNLALVEHLSLRGERGGMQLKCCPSRRIIDDVDVGKRGMHLPKLRAIVSVILMAIEHKEVVLGTTHISDVGPLQLRYLRSWTRW